MGQGQIGSDSIVSTLHQTLTITNANDVEETRFGKHLRGHF